MGYTEFKALLKKINLKPKGVKEIVLEISDGALAGKIDLLSEMLDGRVAISVDSEIVRYNVQINARTEKPILEYKVDNATGLVSEVKPEGEQAELDLELPKEKVPTTAIPEEISRELVDEFILSGLSPDFEDMRWYPLIRWIERINEGETYLKLSTESGLSSGKVVELVDEYRSRVAPLAAAWDEWRKSKAGEPAVQAETEESEEDIEGHDEPPKELGDQSSENNDDDKQQEALKPAKTIGDDLSDWEREILEGDKQGGESKVEESIDIDTIILTERPQFDDIPYDFPTLLERRKGGETWMQIAADLGISSNKLSTAWSKYKTKIKERGNGAA